MSDDDILGNEPPPIDGLQQWRERLQKFRDECSADYRRRHPEEVSPQARAVVRPLEPVLRAIAKVLHQEIDQVKRQLRHEIRMAQLPRQRKRRMTRAEMDAFVLSKVGLPEETFSEQQREQFKRDRDAAAADERARKSQRPRPAKDERGGR
jgi:hypothetical protein